LSKCYKKVAYPNSRKPLLMVDFREPKSHLPLFVSDITSPDGEVADSRVDFGLQTIKPLTLALSLKGRGNNVSPVHFSKGRRVDLSLPSDFNRYPFAFGTSPSGAIKKQVHPSQLTNKDRRVDLSLSTIKPLTLALSLKGRGNNVSPVHFSKSRRVDFSLPSKNNTNAGEGVTHLPLLGERISVRHLCRIASRLSLVKPQVLKTKLCERGRNSREVVR